jgi:hypothetical protein
MLRPKKFRPFEKKVVWGIGLLLLVIGTTAVLLACYLKHWRLGLASACILVLAAVYVYAAIRGGPL